MHMKEQGVIVKIKLGRTMVIAALDLNRRTSRTTKYK